MINRRQSLSSSLSSGSGSGANEPLIVVEESTQGEEEAERRRNESPPRCLDPDSPSLNPYLLSPWREARKHSLPTPQCTSGITASQVRRLSERGGEGSGPSPREAAFLATLSQASPPQPGGRRHSVVTISRVPPTLFGRNRRESIAAFPLGGVTRVLGGRRDSASGLPSGPPSNSGSSHNLQLDIMDDITEIKAARKVRLKMWKTPSHERVCEVQPLEGNGSSGTQRYTQCQQRRFSDFAFAGAPTLSSQMASTRRRASEMPPRPPLVGGPPPPIPPRSGIPGTGTLASTGIVCTNTDLISILSSLTSSATEIDRCGTEDEKENKPFSSTSSVKTIEQKRNRLKSNRSNSFDVSILHGCDDGKQSSSASLNKGSGGAGSSVMSPSSWFAKRHQPMSKKQRNTISPSTTLSFKFEKSRVVKVVKDTLTKTSPTKDETRHKVVWDGTSGTKVDAQVLGNAIEEFLRSGAVSTETSDTADNSAKPAISPGKNPRGGATGGPTGKVAAWFTGGNSNNSNNNNSGSSGGGGGGGGGGTGNNGNATTTGTSSNNKEDEQTESCEPSICSSLKDLFVK